MGGRETGRGRGERIEGGGDRMGGKIDRAREMEEQGKEGKGDGMEEAEEEEERGKEEKGS